LDAAPNGLAGATFFGLSCLGFFFSRLPLLISNTP
jgi:hypothetical protein